MPERQVYLDHAATTPLAPGVLEAMLPFLTSDYGNPSATYRFGKHAGDALSRARRRVAEVLGCKPGEVVFTGAGTESINAAIKGVAFQQRKARSGNHIVTAQVEHHAVLHTCQYLERFGFDVTYLPVDGFGRVAPDDVARAITSETSLVSVMTANNEIGTVQRIAEIASAVRERAATFRKRIPLHTDAVQAPRSMALEPVRAAADLLSLSAHKFGGPKGVGVLYIGRGVPFLAQQNGGGQERQRRAGTENVAGIVGTAAALAATQDNIDTASASMRKLAHQLRDGIAAKVQGTRLNGHGEQRLANNVSISFEEADARDIVAGLDAAGVMVSAGAACNATTIEPSHVLIACGVPLELAAATIRFSLGPETTVDDISYTLGVLPEIVEASRKTRREPAA